MYKIKSECKNVGFYYNNRLKKFSNGFYTTEDKKEAEMLIESGSFKLIETHVVKGKKKKNEKLKEN